MTRRTRVNIAGTIRSAFLLPRPDPERFAQLLDELVPDLDLRVLLETSLWNGDNRDKPTARCGCTSSASAAAWS